MGTYKSIPIGVDDDLVSQISTIAKPKPAIGSVNAEITPRLGTKSMNR